ncbi:helix-turn-helix domain-containing protein [Puia dinghuensis]|uniref:HTH araC/xylS-type domain-containing protein n=1 Tax=Puia dinghuensis TaxID=1792502 RepID=A0A8J2XTU9_9BACT|nr:helix-turn-helix domain-containing protein [Puia dinghuensis]GGB20552.1 hypothetical protein GCM10011511_50360 [Puia dinghuensis]
MNPSISIVRIGPYHLTPSQIDRIATVLHDFIPTRKPFLLAGYTLKDLARDTQLPLHHISAFINQYHGMHFNEFINRYRVAYFHEKIVNEEWKQKKLGAIAKESGFKNRNTFTIAFKKVHGQNPSAYIKTIKGKVPRESC